jgi:tetratricopeptide (TPR) repeat protein
MYARLLLPPVLLAFLALPSPLPAWGQSAEEIYCSNRSGRLPADQVMAACDKLTADAHQTDLWRAKAYAWRGIAQMRAGTPTAALADFNRALELDDENYDALYGRGQIRYSNKDYAAALEDLDGAVKLQPKYTGPYLLRSNIYLALHRHAEAIADADNAFFYGGNAVLNQRCWTRAVAGVELDKARTACDQALWVAPAAPAALNSRGLLNLKEKKFDAAWRDFNAAVSGAPRNPRSLYGRGIAAIALGRETEGKADIAAATILLPGIAATYADYGIRQ